MTDQEIAASLLHKLGEFTQALGPGERELFAALIGPGIAEAMGGAEVEGFASSGQESDRLVRALTELAGRAQPAIEGDTTADLTAKES